MVEIDKSSIYSEINDRILGIEIEKKPKGFWIDKNKIPLIMRRMWHLYEDKEVPFEETFTIDIDKKNPFHMLIVGKTGRQKTRIVKNIIRGFYKAGYRVLFIEPKKMDMVEGIKPGRGVRLATYDYNEKEGLDIVSYTPSCFYDYCKRILRPSEIKKTNFYSLDITTLDYIEIWMSFGVPIKGAEIIVQCINNKEYDLKHIKDKIRYSDLMGNTKNISIAALDSLEGLKVFDKRFKPLPLKELWDDGKIVVLNFHNKQGRHMNTFIGLAVTMAKNIGQMEKVVTKKLIVGDDSFMYLGAMAFNFAKADVNYAQNEFANCQYNYRSFGIDSIVIVQNLDIASIHPTIIEGRDEFLVTRTGSSEILRGLIPFNAYMLVTNQNPEKGRVLYSDKKNYYFEWVYCKEDTFWVSGFPFDCVIGHPIVGG